MDYAKNRYSNQFVEDIKALYGVIFVFLPVPVFWALFDQQVRLEVDIWIFFLDNKTNKN